MPEDPPVRDNTQPEAVNWFGVAGSAIAWLCLGLGDIFLTWRICLGEEKLGGPGSHPEGRALYFAVAALVIATTLLAGTMCYRNWRRLAGAVKLLRAEGDSSGEFLALSGLFMSITLGAGMLWLSLPLLMIEMCLRAR